MAYELQKKKRRFLKVDYLGRYLAEAVNVTIRIPIQTSAIAQAAVFRLFSSVFILHLLRRCQLIAPTKKRLAT